MARRFALNAWTGHSVWLLKLIFAPILVFKLKSYFQTGAKSAKRRDPISQRHRDLVLRFLWFPLRSLRLE